MTASSLCILERPAHTPPANLEPYALQAGAVQRLSLHADACGPYGLQIWAEKHGHPLHDVDTCWVRARVPGLAVPEFLSEVLKGAVALAPENLREAEHLIEAEAY